MSDSIDKIASAVMYEGYILYPYRPSLKNRQRFNFGVLYPQAYCECKQAGDAWLTQTQCLLQADGESADLGISVRFLHPVQRIVGKLRAPIVQWAHGAEPEYDPVESLNVGGQPMHSWQETIERVVDVNGLRIRDLVQRPIVHRFDFSSAREVEPIRDDDRIGGLFVRQRSAVFGQIQVRARTLPGNLFQLTIVTANDTSLENAGLASRDEALAHSLLATHTILRARGGEFISLTDPPNEYREAAAACHNIGAWPVLVGEEGSRNAVLSAPIILYDYPQIAPESPGDLCDGTEIDEILSLRIMTLTEEERNAAATTDSYAKQLLERTVRLACQQLLGLHGTFRQPADVIERSSHAAMDS